MPIELSGLPRFVPSQNERSHIALLSALAEAPDLPAAATFLLTDILATTGARRALLLRFDPEEEQLVLVAQAGSDDSAATEYAIGDRSHPWMVSTLTLTPVFNDSLGNTSARVPFEVWTALPMPRPHYRGAPAIWTDTYAAEVLTPLGPRCAARESAFSSAPGGVVIVARSFRNRCCRVSSVTMFAGPVLFPSPRISTPSSDTTA
jgi:hypothetical protein